MNVKTNIFIIRTPFQLFNVIEAKNRFHKNEKNFLIIIDNKHPKNMGQIQELLLFDKKWFKIINIPFNLKYQKLFYNFLYSGLIATLKSYNVSNLYLAQYRNISAHIANSISAKKITLFDDGNNMLKTLNFLNNKEEKKYKYFRLVSNYLTGKKHSIDFINHAAIFTLFDTSKYNNLTNQIIFNNYSYFKSHLSLLKNTNCLYFIGSKVIDNGISKEIFEIYLNKILKYCHQNNYNLTYIPHRYEDINYLSLLSKQLNFNLTPFSNIIEFEFFRLGNLPKTVATFRSTGVDTLNSIYNSNVIVFKFSSDQISKSKLNELSLVYDSFIKKSYQIVFLEDI